MTIPRNLRILAELALAFGALLLLDHLLAGDMFRTVQPHPFWLPVLAMALVYGTGAGLSAAAVAIVLWLMAPHPALGIGQDPFDRLVALSMAPMLWVATAALVGEVSAARLRRIARLETRGAALGRNNAALADAHRTLVAANRTLRVRIATEESGVAEAIGVAPGLIHAHPAVRLRTIARLIELDAATTAFSLYAEQDGVWRRQLRGADAPADRDVLPAPLAAAVAESAVPLPIDAPLLAEVGVLALPIRDGEGGTSAVLLFHDLPVARFTQRGMIDLIAVAARLAPLLADEGLRRAGRESRLRVVGSDLVA